MEGAQPLVYFQHRPGPYSLQQLYKFNLPGILAAVDDSDLYNRDDGMDQISELCHVQFQRLAKCIGQFVAEWESNLHQTGHNRHGRDREDSPENGLCLDLHDESSKSGS